MNDTDATAHSVVLEIKNRLGLHARAATLFVKTVASFDAAVEVIKDDRSVDGKSILGLMTLAAGQGSTIELRVTGPQALESIAALSALLDRRFDEDD